MKEYLINFQKNECAINGSCWMLKNKTKTKTGQRKFFPPKLALLILICNTSTLPSEFRLEI